MTEQINQEVLVILLKKIIELLDDKEPASESVSVDNLDVVSASLRNELAKVVKAVKDSQPDNTDVLKELKKLTAAISAIEVSPTINVNAADVTIPEIKLPSISIPDINVPTPQVNYTAPDIHIPAPVVNLPAPIVNVEPADLTSIIQALEVNLNKIRTNSETRPLAVRMSDGQKWVKQLEQLNKQTAQTVQYMSDMSYIRNAGGSKINPATDESLKGISIPNGVGANNTVDLTSANTWYAVPSTVPTSDYVLAIAIETSVGTIRWGYDNTGTPSATNGLQAPSMLTLRMAANQTVYYASSTAGDDVNWTTKVL